jgi:hypothetical protein
MGRWILLLAVLWGSYASAAESHSNFGPGDAYDSAGGPDSGFFVGTFGPVWEHAEFFAPARDLFLTDIEIALGSVNGTPEVIVELTESAPDGRPGAIIESFSVTARDRFESGGSICKATSALKPHLLCGARYWVVVRYPDPANNLVRWHINSVGDHGPVGIREDGGAWSTSGEGLRGVFRVTGSLPDVETACPVPALPPLVTGKAIDWSNPLDGSAEFAGPTTDTIDLELNGSAPDTPREVREDRGILEFDVSSSMGVVLDSAMLEFEIFGPVSGTINVFAYGGDGVVAIPDFQETSALAASPTLTVRSVSIDVTAPVQTLLDGGESTAGFLIALTREDQRLSIHNLGFPPEPRLVLKAATAAPQFLRGDCNDDGQVAGQVTDAVFLLTYNFVGGAEPSCLAACDINADGQVLGQVTDAVYLLSHNFLEGPPPPQPFPHCGAASVDTDAVLGCETQPRSCKK